MVKPRVKKKKILRLDGTPNPRQKLFFDSRKRYVAYGGARGGGKSWALRRKLVLMALRYPGIRMLIVRRSYPELYGNHILPLSSELAGFAEYLDSKKAFVFPNSSRIMLGYCMTDRDVLRYQGQEFDVIALDEATQLSEYQFDTFKACLRGANSFPKRIYLTTNPGGVGHAWVKRLFVDREFKKGENPADYDFVPARVTDNTALMEACPGYIDQLRSISDEKLRKAWLDGDWNVFEGQYFTEFSPEKHVLRLDFAELARRPGVSFFCGMDYGFDMLCVLLIACLPDGSLYAARELCQSSLTLSEAAVKTSAFLDGVDCSYIAASPDLWNRRQDSGYSGVEIMNRAAPSLPPLIRADDRRVIGWLTLREYLRGGFPAMDFRSGFGACSKGFENAGRGLRISDACPELIRCLPSLLYDRKNPDDASGEPHDVTHAPEALRYAVMSRPSPSEEEPDTNFSFSGKFY